MKIRPASITDAFEIADIHAESWRATYSSVLTMEYLRDKVPRERIEIWKERLGKPKENQCVFVAESQERVVGFSCGYSGENVAWGSYLDNLHVRKQFQSQGVGTSLLLAVANWCYERDHSSGLCLLVNQDNIKAQNFYTKLGAHNKKSGVWNAPDGSVVDTYWFAWDKLSGLVKNG